MGWHVLAGVTRSIFFLLLLFPCQVLLGQESAIFALLRTPVDPYVTALGGYEVSSVTPQPTFALQNPALLLPVHAGRLSMAYVNYRAGIHLGEVLYSFSLSDRHTMAVGGSHVAYGDFDGYDAAGTRTYRFGAQDNMLTALYAFSLPSFSFGVSLKPVFSKIERYTARGLFADAGALLKIKESFSFGVSIKEVMFLAQDDAGNSLGSPSLDVWLGGSLRPRQMPLRLSFTWYRLAGTLPYYYEEDSPVYAHRSVSGTLFDEIVSRANLSAEVFLLRDRLRLLFGLNFARRHNFSLNEENRLAGLSFGIFFSARYFQVVLSRNHYVGTGSMHLGVVLDLNRLYAKKKVNDT